MRQTSSQNVAELQIKLTRKYLKLKILEDNITFRNHRSELHHVYELLKRTVSHGESHSALMIGPRGCGKTTLVNSALHQLSREVDLESDAIIVRLSGLVHHDEKVALKAITAQMQLENAVGDRVFGTFAENLSFLLSCLHTGADRRCRSLLFLLDEFHMFCHSGRTQTLLYNLFDVTHSGQAPLCVLGITNRIDVMELLEKRVKSRFSHRHIFLFPNNCANSGGAEQPSPVANYRELLVKLLSLPTEKRKGRKEAANYEEMDIDQSVSLPVEVLERCKIDTNHFAAIDQSHAQDWNAHIRDLADDEKVVDALEKLCYYTVNEQIFRNVLFQSIAKLGPRKPYLNPSDLTTTIDNTVAPEHRTKLLQSLSVLELSLVIAMMHGADVLDGQPVNFEMVLHRYTKFANANSSTQTVPRPVILKAFEHLQALEIILPVRGEGNTDSSTSRVQKEYKLFTLSIPHEDIREAVKGFKALPTEISHWASNSID